MIPHAYAPFHREASALPAETRWYARMERVEPSRLVRAPRRGRLPPWRILLRALTPKRASP